MDEPETGRTSNLEPLFSLARQNKLSHDQLKNLLLHLDVHEVVSHEHEPMLLDAP